VEEYVATDRPAGYPGDCGEKVTARHVLFVGMQKERIPGKGLPEPATDAVPDLAPAATADAGAPPVTTAPPGPRSEAGS